MEKTFLYCDGCGTKITEDVNDKSKYRTSIWESKTSNNDGELIDNLFIIDFCGDCLRHEYNYLLSTFPKEDVSDKYLSHLKQRQSNLRRKV